MRPRSLVAVAAVAALVAAGCGRDNGSGQGATTTSVTQTTRVELLDGGGDGHRRTAGDFDPEQIFREEGQGVVTVLAQGYEGSARGEGGLGSGFVVSGQGEIVTNAHVVTTGEGRSIQRARELYARFADGNQVAARIVGFDPFSDVALLKVDPSGLTLRPLPLGATRDVAVGAPVAAIGSPYGEEQSLSVGVISAKNRSIESLTGFATSGALQTDAAINSGNSGGPLLDADGRVLGINSQIRSSSGSGSGVGFAVPAEVVKRSIGQLRRHGEVRYAYLGVTTQQVYPQLAEALDLGTDHGAILRSVVAGGPAASADLRPGSGRKRFQGVTWPTGGDVITRVGRHEIRDESDLSIALLDYEPGETAPLRVMREGRARTVNVRLGTRPVDSPRG